MTLQSNHFKEVFPKTHKPKITDLDEYWSQGIAELFHCFVDFLLQEYDLRLGIPTWSETYGWIYRIGKSGVYLINGIQIPANGFIIDKINISVQKSYTLLLQHIKNIYTQKRDSFLSTISEKNLKQAERNKLRIARERDENSEIGCHNQDFGDFPDDFRQCTCSFQYSYREYRRNYRKNNMPTGAAAETFSQFILDWSLAISYRQKIILIDTLLHEFHKSLVSGAVHRPVAMNFIDGTRQYVETVIQDLATLIRGNCYARFGYPISLLK